MEDANVSEPVEQGFSWDGVEILSKFYKVTVDFQRPMSCLLNDGPEGKDVNNGLMIELEYFLSLSSEMFMIKLTRELPMES
jgi:hypothetical protein